MRFFNVAKNFVRVTAQQYPYHAISLISLAATALVMFALRNISSAENSIISATEENDPLPVAVVDECLDFILSRIVCNMGQINNLNNPCDLYNEWINKRPHIDEECSSNAMLMSGPRHRKSRN